MTTPPDSSLLPFVLTLEQRTTLQGPVGGPVAFLARGATTGGTASIIENEVSPGAGPPLHSHDVEHETWYVVSGNFRFRLGDDVHTATAGSFIFVPAGTPHTFQNVGARAGRIVVTFSPAGMEGFFEELATLRPEDIGQQTFAEIGARYGMTVLGPPMATSHPITTDA
jgi:quercetin dioxygenase-like cupin family protein